MKILVINWRDIKNPEAGGAEAHLHEIFRRIVKRGHEVILISSKYDNCKDSEIIDGINVFRIGNKFNFNFVVPFYYLRKLRKEKFDIVIDDISKIPLCTPLYVKKPLIAVIHHIHGDTLFKELPIIMASYVWLLERLLLPLYKRTKIITVSKSTKDELSGIGIPYKNISVVHNGNNHKEMVDIILANNNRSKIPLIVYVGRIKAYKQLDHLIKAFNIIRNNITNSKLIIAGKGDKNYLRNILSDFNLDSSVEFYDEISEEEKLKLLHNAWVFVTPSMKEGWGITIIEANSCGTPAIGYDVPGLRDSIRNGDTGLLVKPGSIDELAKSIIKIIQNDKFQKRLTNNALEWSKKFDWDNSAEIFEDELLKMA